MGRISNTELYQPKNVLSQNDLFVITSTPDGNDTQTTTPQAVANFITQNQNASFQYTYSDGSDADIDSTDPGFFESRDILNMITTDPTMVSQFRVNDENGTGFDLSELYSILATNPTSVVLQIQGVDDPNVIATYTLSSIVDNGADFLINVNLPPIYSSVPPSGSFVHRDVYNLFFIPFVQPVQDAVAFGGYTIYKAQGNGNLSALEAGDIAQGWFSNTLFFEAARFDGGDPAIIGNWTQISVIDFT